MNAIQTFKCKLIDWIEDVFSFLQVKTPVPLDLVLNDTEDANPKH